MLGFVCVNLCTSNLQLDWLLSHNENNKMGVETISRELLQSAKGLGTHKPVGNTICFDVEVDYRACVTRRV